MNKETVYFDSRGPSGNIYHIIGLVREEMRRQRRISDYNECRDKVFESQSYEDALAVIGEYVNLIDTSKKKASITRNVEKRINADLEDEFQHLTRTNIQETEMTYVGDTVFEGGTDYEIRAILATQNGGLEESELTLVEALNLDDESTAYLIILDGEVDHVEENKTAAIDFYNSYFSDLDEFDDEWMNEDTYDEWMPDVEKDDYYLPTDASYDSIGKQETNAGKHGWNNPSEIDPKLETQKILSKIKSTVGKEQVLTRTILEREGYDSFDDGETFSNWAKGNMFVYFQWNEAGRVTYIDARYSDDELGVLYEEDYPSGGVYASSKVSDNAPKGMLP